MASYEWLNSLPAQAFLDPNNFLTEYDEQNKARGYDQEQYRKGLETGRAAKSIHISENSVWGAEMKSGGMLSSSEGIGYHACTADLLRGFLDSGCEIIVYRRDEGTVKIK